MAETKTFPRLRTVGHLTRPIGQFLRLLQAHGVACVADARTIPRSYHNPQFNADVPPASLSAAGIGCRRLADLGGLRHPTAVSVNAPPHEPAPDCASEGSMS